METIDLKLLKRFQKVADVIQLWIGLTNFQISKITLTIALTAWLELRIEEVFWDGWTFWVVIGILVGALFYFYITHRINIGERNCHQNPLFQSELSISFAFLRKITFYLVIIATYSFIFFSFVLTPTEEVSPEKVAHLFRSNLFLWITSLAEFVTFYFASCTPKPKKPSKVREWLGKSKLKLQTQRA